MNGYLVDAMLLLSAGGFVVALLLLLIAVRWRYTVQRCLADTERSLKNFLNGVLRNDEPAVTVCRRYGAAVKALSVSNDALKSLTKDMLVPAWLKAAARFVNACDRWTAQASQVRKEIPTKNAVAELRALVDRLLRDEGDVRALVESEPLVRSRINNIAGLIVRNTDFYYDKDGRNSRLQVALCDVVDAAEMKLLSPKPNEHYTDIAGVTRVVGSVTCRGLRCADGEVIFDATFEENTF